MEYMITRTSKWDNEKPYEGVYPKTVTRINYDKTIEEVERWFLKIETIDELMTLHIQCGEWLIMGTDNDYQPPQPFIEIYDSYRE